MAKNLRAKLPKEDTLYIQDVNAAVTEKFMSTGLDENVKVAASPREVAENAVRYCLSSCTGHRDEHDFPVSDLSWGCFAALS